MDLLSPKFDYFYGFYHSQILTFLRILQEPDSHISVDEITTSLKAVAIMSLNRGYLVNLLIWSQKYWLFDNAQ